MLKVTQIELVYKQLCFREFKGKNKSPNEIEKILFLMQYNALKNGDRRVYRYKTYIDGNDVRIKYMSDLLRVMPLTNFSMPSEKYSFEMKEIVINQELIKEYMVLSKEELDALVQWVIANEELSPHYFVFKKYENKIMRVNARFQYYFNLHIIKAILFMFNTAMIIMIIFSFILVLPILIDPGEYNKTQVIKGLKILIIMLAFLGIPWSLWIYKFLKPTKYEKNNHYTK